MFVLASGIFSLAKSSNEANTVAILGLWIVGLAPVVAGVFSIVNRKGEVQLSDKGMLIQCGGKGHLLAWSSIQRCEFNGGAAHELLLKGGEDPKTWCARLPSNSSDSSEWVRIIEGVQAAVTEENERRDISPATPMDSRLVLVETIPFHTKPAARWVVGLGIVAVIAGLVAAVFIDSDERRLVWLIRVFALTCVTTPFAVKVWKKSPL